MSELNRNILNFGDRINFKYEGMVSDSFNRFHVVIKFIFTPLKMLNFYQLILIQSVII